MLMKSYTTDERNQLQTDESHRYHYRRPDDHEWEEMATLLFDGRYRSPAFLSGRFWKSPEAAELANVILQIDALNQDFRDGDNIVQWIDLRSIASLFQIHFRLWGSCHDLGFHRESECVHFFQDWSRRAYDLRVYNRREENMKEMRGPEFELRPLDVILGPGPSHLGPDPLHLEN